MELKGKGGIRRKHIQDDVKATRRYWNLNDEALDFSV
jgi:hypothetical protein